MKMWAIAYQYDEDYFWDFEKHDVTYGIEPSQLLPTKELADQLINDILSDDFVSVDIDIESYRSGGAMSYTIGKVDRWEEDNWDD